MNDDNHWLPNWAPHKDIIVGFDDKTGQYRSQDMRDSFIEELNCVAGKYGFAVNKVGLPENFAKFFRMPEEALP